MCLVLNRLCKVGIATDWCGWVIMLMRILSCAIIICSCLACGCSGALSTEALVPVPWFDLAVQSVDCYNKRYKIDLQSMQHDMQEEIASENRVANNPLIKININGKQVKAKPKTAYMTRSKQIGPNDYLLTCGRFAKLDRQKGEEYCWAACVSVFIC